MNHYEVLGVDATASAAQLRSAYLQLARQHHPDFHQGSGPSSQKPVADSEFRMRQVNAAWQVLGNPDRRSEYDQLLRMNAARQLGGVQAAGTVQAVGHRDQGSSNPRLSSHLIGNTMRTTMTLGGTSPMR